jgi:2-polyprenyl-3-methyl-5-hydroxy-6-metoxy-1,4-benzoquinol methylase
MAQTDWEAQYVGGRCDYYREISELARYHIVAGYCHYLKPAGTILDLGCGEGILQERLDPSKYSRYVGVDFSSEAINRATNQQDEKTLFVTADISTYIPDGKFDVIIFSECIMCFKEPVDMVKRYDNFLKVDGFFIISLVSHESTTPVWKILEHTYSPADEVVVSHKGVNLSWIIKVYGSLQGKE